MTNIPDSEIERRLATLTRLLGMNREDFLAFIQRPYVNTFWLGCGKYQASSVFTFAPLADYAVEHQRRIPHTPYFFNFELALPISEQARLGDHFESIDLTRQHRLDAVVLTKDASLASFAPPRAEFELTFENAMFRVWTRRATPPENRDRRPPATQ